MEQLTWDELMTAMDADEENPDLWNEYWNRTQPGVDRSAPVGP